MVDKSITEKLTQRQMLERLATMVCARARDNLLVYSKIVKPDFEDAAHVRLICEKLEAVERGDIKRLMIFMPPRSGKSLLSNVLFPSWYLGRHPKHQVLAVSYSKELAEDWGRSVRDLITSSEYQAVFPSTQISPSSRAAAHWDTRMGGKYRSGGITAGISGKGAHIALIDDPLSEQDAFSKAARRRVQQWYPGGLRTRLMPNGAIILVSCMTGDTSITMSDGTRKRLDDIKVGDEVMSWSGSGLVHKKVLNWAPQIEDDVYEIKTGNSTVRANGEHPFLVRKPSGKFVWKRTKELVNLGANDCLVQTGAEPIKQQDDRLSLDQAWLLGFMFGDGWVTVRDTTQKRRGTYTTKSGEKRVYKENTYPRRGFVTCVAKGVDETLNNKVLCLFDGLFSCKPKLTRFGYYRTDVAKVGRWFTQNGLNGNAKTKRLPSWLFSQSEAVRREFIDGLVMSDGHVNKNARTVIKLCNHGLVKDIRNLVRSVGFIPTNVHSQERWTQPPNSPKPLLAKSYSFSWQYNKLLYEPVYFRRVRSVKHVGKELVYDIEVEGTGNFIADGLIVHNTRWHQDDLCGWLLREAQINTRSDQWDVLEIPAILDEKSSEIIGLPKGESYWPEWWPLDDIVLTRENMPPSQWNALYMQRPVPEEGGILKSEWFQLWPHDTPPECSFVLQSYDTAFSERTSGSRSAITTWGIFEDKDGVPNMVLLHSFSDRLDYVDLRQKAIQLYKKFEPDALLIEKKASGQSLIQDLRRGGLPIAEYLPDKDRDKVARAYACQPILNGKRVWVREGSRRAEELVSQCASFPAADNVDLVDSTTQAILFMHRNFAIHIPGDDTYEEEPKERGQRRRLYW